MAGPITKELAFAIVKKLKAVDVTDRTDAHDIYFVYHKNEVVGRISIRRASKKDIPCPHVPKDIGVNEHFARLLAQCPKSRNDWLKERGFLEDE